MSVPIVCQARGGTSVCSKGSLACLDCSSWHFEHDLVNSSISLFKFLQNTDVCALNLVFSVPW